MRDLYIGLMSGTSLDAIDAILIDFGTHPLTLIATHNEPLPFLIKEKILSLCQSGPDEIDRLGQLDTELGLLFATASLNLLRKTSFQTIDIKAIGSHGQTIRHRPQLQFPFTLQIGDPNTIAANAGITTVSDFRRRDIAVGGQGAPLVPAFHHYLFRHAVKNRVIVNIGGMANLTILPKNEQAAITGFDTGPGNVLLDGWIKKHLGKEYDAAGQWAKSGHVNGALLQNLLADPFFHKAPPKSTGREYFNIDWLEQKLTSDLPAQDVQATLIHLTAHAIVQAIKKYSPDCEEIYICGGGAHNAFLIESLKAISPCPLETTSVLGIDPNWLEAMAFAWLARQTLMGQPSNIPTVTGAKSQVILGGIYRA